MNMIQTIPIRSHARFLGVSVLAFLLSAALAPINTVADGSSNSRGNGHAYGKANNAKVGQPSQDQNEDGQGNGKNQDENQGDQNGQPKVIHVPGDFAHIQDAVKAANPGATILVAAGTYNEPQIEIDKSLSVLGEDANTTIIDGGNSTGLTSVGLVRIIADGGTVVFSGFTLKNAGPFQTLRVGLFVNSFVPATTFLITHNRIIGSNNPNDEGDYGMYAIQGFETLIFQENEITQTGSNPIIVQQHVGPTDISGNKLDVGAYGSDAIFTFTFGGWHVDSKQTRNNNVIDVGTGGPFDAAHRATGILFAGAFRQAPYTTDQGGGRFTQVEIKGNTIINIQGERRGLSLWDGADGDGLAGDIPGAMVQGNVFSGVGKAAGSKGIQLLGRVSGVKLINNHLSDLDIGIHLRDWLSGGAIGTKIIANRFDNVNKPLSTDPEAIDTKYHGAHVSP